MANALGFYDPEFYAQEALIWLRKALGLANRVHRGYDATPQQLGSVINIRKPSTFTATTVDPTTGGTTQDVTSPETQISLNQWKEVKFQLTDKEITHTGEQIIQDHIAPAAYALADAIDQAIAGQYIYVPWKTTLSSTLAVSDLTAARRVLFDNQVPMDPAMLHFMVDGGAEAQLLNLAAFTQWQGSGPSGEQAQLRGSIGTRYGMEFFANQNTPDHLSGTMADTAGTLTGASGDTTVTIGALTNGETVKAGDSFVVAGNTQRYTILEDKTVASSALTSVAISPALVQAYSGAVVTLDVQGSGTTKAQNMAFHRDAFALAMAPLSMMGAELGARIATVTDPVSNISIRSRLFYIGELSTVKVALDVLYGVKTLNPNLAVRVREN